MKLTFVEETPDERSGLLFWLRGDGWFVRRVNEDEYTLHSPARMRALQNVSTRRKPLARNVARVKQYLDAHHAEPDNEH